jgi:hypothetical protein
MSEKEIERKLNLVIGGYPGPWYEVSLEPDGRLRHVEQTQDGETETFVTPSKEDWERFLRSCKRIGIDGWVDIYVQPVCDGTNWEFEIQFDSLNCKVKGSNHYPMGFQAFLSAVTRLLRGLNFQ